MTYFGDGPEPYTYDGGPSDGAPVQWEPGFDPGDSDLVPDEIGHRDWGVGYYKLVPGTRVYRWYPRVSG